MADVPLDADKLGLLEKIWDWLVAGANWNSWTGVLAGIVLWVVLLVLSVAFLIWALRCLLESLTKALEAYKESGLPLTLRGEKRAQVRRRQQFCKVLNSDLLTLAKAENWNDQYFTDLEAEVEAEGGYYATFLHKMLGRQSRGLRLVSSLISAIEPSSEQALLLVGQPGSGKSVALRHLAHQFAERAIRSADPQAIIPLYVNLKELSGPSEGGMTADSIKQFVLDNVRRGDADTVAYVRQHWDDYRARGIWFFLFDSFDEIPAVLHAPTGSAVIRNYSEAIRQFLEGMSSCRGIVASREFKGPDALPWQKVRILALSEERQEQLIGNSFLEPEKKEIVYHHLASSSSSLRNNPLFLTLLCRYVKDEDRPPVNDHDLLSGHIDRLASRDEDYTRRKYDLSPEQLIEGALQIAVLFAERPALSLTPTQAEIAAEFQERDVPGGSLENMLGALVDVKIGRSDVQEARAGDRRFTFSHRRYQETLFVRHLARQPNYLSARELLTDTRWREYTVTLLQTQDLAVIKPLLLEATSLLAEYAARAIRVPILEEFGGHLAYYDWDTDPAVPLLTVLQEGMGRRLADVPVDLSIQIEQLLEPRWKEGDMHDRRLVLQLGGLLPQPVLEEHLAYAVSRRAGDLEDVAFERVVFLKNMPAELATWVRERLSTEAMLAVRRVDILRLEALAARLPSYIGAVFVLRRCQLLKKLRRPLQLIIDWTVLLPVTVLSHFRQGIRNLRSYRQTRHIALAAELALALYLPTLLFATQLIKPLLDKTGSLDFMSVLQKVLSEYRYLVFGLLAYGFMVAAITTLYSFRSVGSRLNLAYIVERLNDAGWTRLINRLTKWVVLTCFIILACIAPGALTHGVAWILGYRDFGVSLYFGSFGTVTIGVSIFVSVIEYRKRHRFRDRFRTLYSQAFGSAFVLQAQSLGELEYWLDNEKDLWERDVSRIRSLLRLLDSPNPYQPGHSIFGLPLFRLDWSERTMHGVLASLLRDLKRVGHLDPQASIRATAT
ncbi:MAG: NACHT domain-containing protein [Gammaproteobacteria bacterium]